MNGKEGKFTGEYMAVGYSEVTETEKKLLERVNGKVKELKNDKGAE